ncbi:hypothetical protein E4N75_00030 [Treponema putidum]|nr:hypothetical protein E4N75_00030 [Treponema putidum]
MKIFIGDTINSSAEIQPHCLSSSFVLLTKHRLFYVLFHFVAKALLKPFFGS